MELLQAKKNFNEEIGIGIPLFNGSEYIEETIKSIQLQTHKNFKIFISDNCSTDNSWEILSKLSMDDNRIHLFRQSSPINVYKNYEFVRDYFSNSFFMWHASDDAIEPKFIEKLLVILKRHPEIACVASDVKRIDAQGNYIDTISLNENRYSESKINLNQIQKHFFKNPTTNTHFSIYGLFRMKFLKKVSMNLNGKIRFNSGSEIPQLAQVALEGRIYSINDALKLYRVHDDSLFNQERNNATLQERLLNYLNISNCLLGIIFRSSEKFSLKINLCLTVIYSFGRSFLKKLF